MSEALAIYLHDHLAGSRFAIELLKSLQEQYQDEPLGEFARILEIDIIADQVTLQKIIDRVGPAHFDLKEAAGWFAEKAAQLKLREDHASGGIGTFEAVETLVLGIRGKLALWHVMRVARTVDPRIPSLDFEKLAASAEEQSARVEKQRLQLAATTFRPQP
jgi:hypothetical protein